MTAVYNISRGMGDRPPHIYSFRFPPMTEEWDSGLQLTPRRERAQVKIEQARRGDASDLAKLFLTSFETNDMIRIMFPWRQNYYGQDLLDRWQTYEARQFQLRIVSDTYCYKATATVEDENGRKKDMVVGVVGWSHKSKPCRRSLWEWLLARVYYPVYMYLNGHTPLNMDNKMMQVFVDKYNDTFGEGGIAHGRDPMYVNIVCVLPEWQGRGIGSALIDFTMDEAKKNDAVVYLESGLMAYPLYLRKGFIVSSDKPHYTLGRVFRAPAMIWEPRRASNVPAVTTSGVV